MDFLVVVLVLVFSVVVHEVAHAWQAWREGDPTARDLGRITLNPLPHLDLVGSLLVPVALHLLPGGFVFGWAKPVPVNPENFRDYRGGDIRVSLAGVAANLALVAVLSVAGFVLWRTTGGAFGSAVVAGAGFSSVLFYGILINLTLAWINLIPVPPLDGSRVLLHLLPRSLRAPYLRFGRFGAVGVLLVVALAPGAFSVVFAPVRLALTWILGLVLG